ncbi:hypothetical protein HK101_009071 [Irineochytrium annulatum]|nr:hypothetical protein HK101_009071 [Irineochytrium annulatum]
MKRPTDGDSESDQSPKKSRLSTPEVVTPAEVAMSPQLRILIAHRRTKPETLLKKYPGCTIFDVTSKGVQPWVRFSPFYPHGGIPVPNDPERFSQSVEGIWQGLKVFEKEGVDASRLAVKTMKSLKRTSTAGRGRVLGHAPTFDSKDRKDLIAYVKARKEVFVPAYKHLLERMGPELEEIREKASTGIAVLLDYDLNTDIEDTSKPMSHAGLIKLHLEGKL